MSEPPFEDPTVLAPADGTSAGSPSVAPMDPGLVQALREFGPGHYVFGRFTLSRELGKGGMGVVWLAHDERLGLDVALKFLAGMVSADAEALQDLRREITRGLVLTHPGIVRMYDLHEDQQGLAAIAMEYVAGSTLTDEKNRRPDRCFDPPELTAWVRQLCDVLAYVHEKAKVVHRDLKPRNLMLNAERELKVTDFGIAATLSDSQSRLTNLNTSGTPAYMSPQQASGYRPTATDDIYAMGATLYELLTSKPPFFRGAGATLLHQLLNQVPPSMESRREELGITGRPPIPAVWEETIAACLAKEPEQRPASVREVARRLLDGEELAVETASEPEIEPVTELAKAPPAPAPPPWLAQPPPPGAPPPRRRSGSFGRFLVYSLLAVGLSLPGAWYLAHRPGGSVPGASVVLPSSDPILRIDAGMHTAFIHHLATDRRGTLVLTVSRDKTARLWNATGKLLKTLRPPIGPGHEGDLLTGDLSPDGSVAAVGGVTGLLWEETASVYLFDTASGRLVRRLKNLPGAIGDVAFSPDGKLLAVGLAKGGLRFFEAGTGKLIGEDPSEEKDVSCVRFSPDGSRLATSCRDGIVRLYATPALSAAGQPLQFLASEKPVPAPGRLSFAPTGDLLAVGAEDNTPMTIVSGRDLKPAYSPWKQPGRNQNLLCSAWSADGQTLYGGGVFRHSPTEMFVRIWNSAGHGDSSEWVVATGLVTDLRAIPKGGVFFTSGDPSWGMLDPQGHATTYGKSPLADAKFTVHNFYVSGDASVVDFYYQEHGGKPAQFSLLERKLTPVAPGETADPRLHTPKLDGLNVTGWRNGTRAKINGETIAAAGRNHALAIAADNSFFVLGADRNMQGCNADGTVRWAREIHSFVSGINLSNDGKIVVAIHGDGHIRWYSAEDGRLLLTFFPHADGERWVAWTPEGFYDASGTGEELVGWHVNQGKEREAAFYPAAKYRDKFYRPDMVARALDVSVALPANPAVEIP